MLVKLLHYTPVDIIVKAIRRCYDSDCLSDSTGEALGEKDLELIRRIIESGHTSTIEHAVFTFDIDGISRACLQELMRHRVASPSVKSSRYCLGRIKNEEKIDLSPSGRKIGMQYLVGSGNYDVDNTAVMALGQLRCLAIMGIPNDNLKYCMPEAMKTSLILTINARSLRNLLELRLSIKALWEIRELAGVLLGLIPESHKMLFEGLVK